MIATKIKTIRFILNFLIYAGILISTIYYSYTNQPGLFMLKDYLIPMKGTILLGLILAGILAGINEIMTMFIVKLFRGR